MEEILEQIKKFLIEKCNPEVIILFGSYARNTQNAESDIDIAIKPTIEMKKIEIFNIKNELQNLTNKDIDLINLNSEISEGFMYEILMNGKVIFCKDEEKFDEYKLQKCCQYLTFNEDRQIIIQKLKEGGTLYGK